MNRFCRHSTRFLGVLAIVGACSSPASAATLSFNFQQSGSNVTLTATGAIADLSSWFNSSTGSPNPTVIKSGSAGDFLGDRPGEINVNVGGLQVRGWQWLAGPSGSSVFGTGGAFYESATSPTGDPVGFNPGGVFAGPFGTTQYNPKVTLPLNYVPGDAINTSATFTGQSFASLGLTPNSSFSWTYGIDTVEIMVAAVPEPSTCAMALAGIACGGYLVRRRRKRA